MRAGYRAAVLICYEQLLTWPILTSMVDHPTAIVAVANDVDNDSCRPTHRRSRVGIARKWWLPWIGRTGCWRPCSQPRS
jgi:hypothetical protein